VTAARPRTRREELYAEVVAFHRAHPEVWAHFERYALQLVLAGRARFGARCVWERLRWESLVNPGAFGSDELKLNNNHFPFYSRRFARLHPEHAQLFRFRVQRSAERPPKRSGPPRPSDFTPDDEV